MFKRIFIRSFSCILFVSTLACTPSSNQAGSQSPTLESFAAKPSAFRVSLTDAPHDQLKSVFINIHSIELWLSKNGKEARLELAKNLGLVDLMALQNGVLLPAHDFSLPSGITIKKVRIMVEPLGNYAVKTDGSICQLKTPSGQQSGVKINFKTPVIVEDNNSYSLVIDFDAKKSVVVKGNGGCNLKPVIKIAGFTKLPLNLIDPDGSTDQSGEDLTDGQDNSNNEDVVLPEDASTDDGSGFDPPTDPIYIPGVLDPDHVSYYF